MPSAPKAAARRSVPANTALVVKLGRALFNDTTLSEPAGMACVSCHDPSTGFSYPDSDINLKMGPVPGVVPGRFGFRKPPTVSYAAFLPTGVPYFVDDLQAFVGGLFWDGRAVDATGQAQQPFVNPNEMNNLIHNVGSPEEVVNKVRYGPSGNLFRQAYGSLAFEQTTAIVYRLMGEAIQAYERSAEVSPFSSKYDAYLVGKYTLTSQEIFGLREFTGSLSGRPGGIPFRVNAHCSECHGIPTVQGDGPDLFSNSCFANIGAFKNPSNPYYKMTNRQANPAGYNPLGSNFIDFGLGDFMYPYLGKPVADLAEDDPLAIDGTFKTPILRNVDKRPSNGFVRSYMHNGAFKSLAQVVHFYNTRNLTTVPGEVIDFTKPDPYAGLVGTPLWPRPEWPSPISMINPAGLRGGTDGDMGDEQIGNMNLSPYQEQCLVAFLKTLTDGYFIPTPTIKP